MAEWLLVILAIVGIVLLGFFFSALDFFKGLTRFLIFGLLVFLLFLLANRFLPSINSSQYGRNYPSGEDFEVPRLDPNSDASEYLRNLGEDIDEFVFGPPESYPDTTPDGTAPSGTTSRSRDFVYTIPGTEQDPGTIAEQPASGSSPSQTTAAQRSAGQTANQSTSQPANQTSGRRPVSAMW